MKGSSFKTSQVKYLVHVNTVNCSCLDRTSLIDQDQQLVGVHAAHSLLSGGDEEVGVIQEY